jgi:hypothetical protein
MMIDRRTFIINGTTFLAAAPALAVLLPGPSIAQTPLLTRAGADENSVLFKIDGWDAYGAEASNGNEVWLRIDQSWRAAWR